MLYQYMEKHNVHLTKEGVDELRQRVDKHCPAFSEKDKLFTNHDGFLCAAKGKKK